MTGPALAPSVLAAALQGAGTGGAVRQAADTLPAPAPSALLDSVVVDPVVPDPLVPLVQWIFQRPPWVMQLGIVLGAMVAVALGILLWRRRQAIAGWWGSRSRAARIGLGGGVVALLLAAGALGWKANQYVMHDNNFCQGCHIFVPSGHAWVKPDTGNYLLVNALEGKHDTLSCHSCHPFDIRAQSRELYFWIMDRPEEVPPHGRVPRDICEQCHVQGAANEKWQRIASTAGHRTHFESDSVARIVAAIETRIADSLGDHVPKTPRPHGEVSCLTCHARSAHKFQPPDTTCAQQGCHLTDEIQIRLGKMADQIGLHCSVCHEFTADVPALATRDSAAGTLRPTRQECLGCHEMRAVLADFDPAADPHGGTCGMCHNPHTQVRPADALKSCATASCHGDWRAVPFHTGAAHRRVAEQCQTCHQPHRARVDASDCASCHTNVEQRSRGRIRPPQPFDTTEALQRVSMGATVRIEVARVTPAAQSPPARPDSFSHQRHRELPCLTCHVPSAPRARLTFERPRGCQICHHQAPARNRCAECHESAELATPVQATMSVTVEAALPGPAASRARPVPFAHPVHAALACSACHTTPVTLEAPAPVRECSDCHGDHHEPGRDCATCHRTESTLPAHARLDDAHRDCAACHTQAAAPAMQPVRPFCLGCHSAATDHYAPRECTVCPFQADPAAVRPRFASGTR